MSSEEQGYYVLTKSSQLKQFGYWNSSFSISFTEKNITYIIEPDVTQQPGYDADVDEIVIIHFFVVKYSDTRMVWLAPNKNA